MNVGSTDALLESTARALIPQTTKAVDRKEKDRFRESGSGAGRGKRIATDEPERSASGKVQPKTSRISEGYQSDVRRLEAFVHPLPFAQSSGSLRNPCKINLNMA
jgi:hypothetical protein